MYVYIYIYIYIYIYQLEQQQQQSLAQYEPIFYIAKYISALIAKLAVADLLYWPRNQPGFGTGPARPQTFYCPWLLLLEIGVLPPVVALPRSYKHMRTYIDMYVYITQVTLLLNLRPPFQRRKPVLGPMLQDKCQVSPLDV